MSWHNGDEAWLPSTLSSAPSWLFFLLLCARAKPNSESVESSSSSLEPSGAALTSSGVDGRGGGNRGGGEEEEWDLFFLCGPCTSRLSPSVTLRLKPALLGIRLYSIKGASANAKILHYEYMSNQVVDLPI